MRVVIKLTPNYIFVIIFFKLANVHNESRLAPAYRIILSCLFTVT